MIWTDDENIERGFDTMMSSKGKSCKNCFWAMKGETDWVTCGHHHDNFKINSLCGYWTAMDDEKVKLYFEKRRSDLKQKFGF